MSGVEQKADYLELAPEQITTDDEFLNLRHALGNEEFEAKRIEKLASSIKQNGQIENGIVIERDGKYVMYSGHRRRRAIVLVNQERTQQGLPLLKMRVMVDRSKKDPTRRAIASNFHREDFTPLEKAYIIQGLRTKHNWEGLKGTKLIAEYLNVDSLTVTQHEKFLAAPKEIQDQLHEGLLSARGALRLMDGVKPHRRIEVLERASEIRRERKLSRHGAYKRKLHGEPKGVDETSIKEAIREVEDAAAKPVALSRKELLEFFEVFDSDVYGTPTGAVRSFCRYYVDKYAKGEGTTATARQKFDAATKRAPKSKRHLDKPKAKKAAK